MWRLLLVLACASLSFAQNCGPNEVWDSCGASCEATCRNPNPQLCTAACVAGCRCRRGFFRNDRGVCVENCGPTTTTRRPPPSNRPPPTTRPPPPPPTTRPPPPPPPPTARPPPPSPPPTARPPPPSPTNRPRPPPPPPTTRPPRPPTPTTSRPSNDRRCGPNEVFDSCGSACEPTCRNPNPQICTLQCVAGCRCRQGFFRDDRGACVANCGQSEGRPSLRPPRQAGPRPPPPPPGPSPQFAPPPPPPAPPQPDFSTPTGFCFGIECQPGTHCEVVTEPCFTISCAVPRPMCVNNVEPSNPSVDEPGPPPPPPPPPGRTCVNAICPAGFTCQMVAQQCLRPPCPPPQPQCVRVQQMICPQNESWTVCSSQCEPTCSNMSLRCNKACGPPKCQCDPGFFRNHFGACVSGFQCRFGF